MQPDSIELFTQAIKEGRSSDIEAMLQENPSWLHTPDNHSWIHWAAVYEQADIIKLLIKYGLEADDSKEIQATALCKCFMSSECFDVFNALLEGGRHQLQRQLRR